MKKFFSIFILGILFSCTNETNEGQDSTDLAVIKLMKTQDKNSLSKSERQTILNYLDKNPESIKYLVSESNIKNMSTPNPDLRAASKTSNYTPADFMKVQAHQPGSADHGASAVLNGGGSFGRQQLIYTWTIANNVLGLFDIVSAENLYVTYNGPLSNWNTAYNIVSGNHITSHLRGNYGPLSWSQTNYNLTYSQYYAWCYTAGRLIHDNSSIPFQGNRYANATAIIQSNGTYVTGI